MIVDDEIREETLNQNIIITTEAKKDFFDVNVIKIKVIKDTELEIDYTSTIPTKLEIIINVEPQITFNLTEIKNKGDYKMGYKYYLGENSNLNITKIHDVNSIKELIVTNLNGKNAKINYLLKTISTNQEKYDLMVYHNQNETESLITNHGVNLDKGILNFNVSGFVPKGKKSCALNQNNQIINLTNEKCTIKPNLFIDENDVIANHSAHIGKCNDQELIYLMSRGITIENAQNLLIQGFLKKGLNNQELIHLKLEKYWR